MPKNIFQCSVCGAFTENPYHCSVKGIFLMDGVQRKRLSKLMSLILRHTPSKFNIALSRDGFVAISELVAKIQQKTNLSWVTEKHIRAVAELDQKGRFEIKGDLIRARYGHSKSLNIEIEYEEVPLNKLPSVLYHGTVESNLPSILKFGLVPMRRKFVHLTSTVEDALTVAYRHKKGDDKVVLLKIDTKKLLSLGYRILRASEKIFLVAKVPSEAISIIKMKNNKQL